MPFSCKQCGFTRLNQLNTCRFCNGPVYLVNEPEVFNVDDYAAPLRKEFKVPRMWRFRTWLYNIVNPD